MEKTIVLYPGLAVSHFVPMVQLADALLEEGYAVKVALIDPMLKQDIALTTVVGRVASSKPCVTFHTLPPIQNPPLVTHGEQFLVSYLELVSRHNQHLHDFICSLPLGSVHALVVDVISFEALDVGRKLGIPVYAFFPSCASFLAVSFQVSLTRAEGQPSLREMGDTLLNLHGVPPVLASQLPAQFLENPETETYKSMIKVSQGLLQHDGILMNTFLSLEDRAVRALENLQCFHAMPPLYCIGPLVVGADEATKKHECLTWLDKQPEHSVVFLCFGSIGIGNHSEKQLKEIANGLEKSGHRFLWVVRAPPPDDLEKSFDPRAEPDLGTILPEGFMDRTCGRGLVVKLWAPQVDVLNHRATGAFVTHCGWNSVLEGIKAGVPMLCWPLYSEQKMNKVFMVEEYGIGMVMNELQHGLVTATEVETKVRLIMESSDEGERIRARVMEHKEAATMAWKDGGSSHIAFRQFLSDAINLRRGPTRCDHA